MKRIYLLGLILLALVPSMFIAANSPQPPSPKTWQFPYLEYRMLVNVTEPNATARDNMPINIFVDFVPNAHPASIRVTDLLGTIVPFQLWNETYLSNGLIDSATITILDSIARNESKSYWIYYDTYNPGPPYVPAHMNISSTPEGYVIETTSYASAKSYSKISTNQFYGGRIYSIVGTNGINYGPGGVGAHFTPEKYEENDHAVVIGKPLSVHSEAGPVFVAYDVTDALKSRSGTVGFVYVNYRFFEKFFLTNVTVKLARDDPVNKPYKIGGLKLGVQMDEMVYYKEGEGYHSYVSPVSMNISDYDFVAMYDAETKLGVSVVVIESSATTFFENTGLVVNINDRESEWYMWVIASGSAGNTFTVRYAILMWNGSGLHDVYTPAFEFYNALKYSLTYVIDHVESQHYSVTVHVLDSEGYPLVNAYVAIEYATNSSVVESAISDELGNVIFSTVPAIETTDYKLVVRYNASGNVIENSSIIFSLTSDKEYTVKINVVLVRVSVLDQSMKTALMNANVTLENSGDNKKYYGYTDYRGIAQIYVPPDSANNYILYVAWRGTPCTVNGSVSHVLGITSRERIVVQTNVTSPPPVAEFFAESYSSRVQWRNNATIRLWFHAGPVEINTNTITLKVLDENNNVVYSVNSLSSNEGIVEYTMNTTLLSKVGNYTLVWNATLDQSQYQGPGVLELPLEVYPVPSTVTISGPSEVYYSGDYMLRIYYRESDTGTPISGANVTIVLWGETISCWYDSSGGFYVYEKMNVTVLPGIYEGTVYLSKDNYVSRITTFIVHVKPRPLLIETTVETLSIEFHQNKTMTVSLIDELNGIKSDVQPMIALYNESNFMFVKLIPATFDGLTRTWNATIVTDDLRPGRYIISIGSASEYMEAEEIYLSLTVLPISAEVNGPSSVEVTVENIFTGEKAFTLSYRYINSRNGEPLSGANVTITINNKTYVLKEISPGQYSITLSTKDVPVGSYVFVLVASKENYSTVTLVGQLRIDYPLGTFYVGETPVPAVWIIIITIVASVVSAIAAIKLIMYYRIPWEARFLGKIISKLEKGEIPDIEPVESREDVVSHVLEKDKKKYLELLNMLEGGENENAG